MVWTIIDAYKSKPDHATEDGTPFGHVKTCKSKEEAKRVMARLKKEWPDIEFKGFRTTGGFDVYADYYKHYGCEPEEKTKKSKPNVEKLQPKQPSRHAQQAFRLGINGLDLKDALALLKKYKIDLIFDVRWNTFFKSNQGFGLDNFKREAAKRGMKHLYVKSLGNPFHKQKDLGHDQMKAKYLEYLDKKYWRVNRTDYFPAEKVAKLREVLEKGARICFICYCKYPDPCHTYWILEKILEHEITKDQHALTALASNTLDSSLRESKTIKQQQEVNTNG